MQEHYLDTISPHSKWGIEYDYQVKGDVVPDNIIFDLNEIEELFIKLEIKTLFCDRNNPVFFEIKKRKYIAPNGGNFILDTRLLTEPKIVKKLKFLKTTFEDNYRWAVFTEFFWGENFF